MIRVVFGDEQPPPYHARRTFERISFFFSDAGRAGEARTNLRLVARQGGK